MIGTLCTGRDMEKSMDLRERNGFLQFIVNIRLQISASTKKKHPKLYFIMYLSSLNSHISLKKKFRPYDCQH